MTQKPVAKEQKLSAKELERKLGLQYSQVLKESRSEVPLYRDCKEAIEASLGIMEYYNRIAMVIKGNKENIRSFA
jgi:hypothetical protein